ncbi:MAG: response regulator [Polyangiaceae bacterium]
MGSSECIVLVDDDPDIREGLAELLQDHGCGVITAANGMEALRALGGPAREEACLILLDLMMPVMDGRTFRQEQLRDDDLARIPVVLISAFAEVENEARALHAAGYLKKPFVLSEVIRTAKEYCACQAPADHPAGVIGDPQ